jgi:hypothetical protein
LTASTGKAYSRAISSGVIGSSALMYIPYNVRARMRLPWMKSCLYADFGFGARYFQVVPVKGFMLELYLIGVA